MNQFAYRKNSSCLVALLLLIDQWKWAIDRKSITVAAFLDLRKAFDVINHDVLLSKLDKAGITGRNYTTGLRVISQTASSLSHIRKPNQK